MLNVDANRKICASGLYSDVFFTPATDDRGLSLGAALFMQRKYIPEIPLSTFTVSSGRIWKRILMCKPL